MNNPILLELPEWIETERLTIRGVLPGDGNMVREAVLESQNELKPWMTWAKDIPSEEEYEVIIREGHIRYLKREELWMLLFLKGTDTLVGGSGLHRINWDVPSCEIGYWVRSRFSRQGYITEVVAGLTNFAFNTLGAKRVEIRCDAQNERSAAVPRRLGFEHEATIHNDGRHHLTNELRDTLIFTKFP